jgi:hypothetical protein
MTQAHPIGVERFGDDHVIDPWWREMALARKGLESARDALTKLVATTWKKEGNK